MKQNCISLLILLSLMELQIIAQTTPDSTAARAECIDTDYQFFILGESYSSGSKIFICANSLPLTINIVKEGDVPLGSSEAENVVWTNANGGSGDMVEAVLEEGNFIGKKVEVFIDFEVNGVGHGLEIKVDKGAEAKIKESKTDFSFDDNEINVYSTYNATNPAGVDWYFLEAQKSLTLKGKIIPNKEGTTIKIKDEPSGHLTLDPTNLQKGKTEIKVSSQATVPQEVTIRGCGTEDLVKVYTAPPKVIEIDIIAICESDDDIQKFDKVGAKVDSANFVCIEPGADGSIDEYRKNYASRGHYMNGDDTVIIRRGKVYVLAGKNCKCETAVKNKKPLCPNSKRVKGTLGKLNEVYEKVGIRFEAPKGIIKTNYNYDIDEEDGILSGEESQHMIGRLLLSLGIPNDSALNVLVLVNNVQSSDTTANNSRGMAPLGSGYAFADTEGELTGKIIGHEIGHSLFSLQHPFDIHTVNDPNDVPNLMYRGTKDFDDTGTISGTILRAYQWPIIHSK